MWYVTNFAKVNFLKGIINEADADINVYRLIVCIFLLKYNLPKNKGGKNAAGDWTEPSLRKMFYLDTRKEVVEFITL